MGRSITPKYVVVIDGRVAESMVWDCKRHGRPSNENVQKYAETFGQSMNPGGVNAHLRNRDGSIPYPRTAHVQENVRNGRVLATWNAPMFMVW